MHTPLVGRLVLGRVLGSRTVYIWLCCVAKLEMWAVFFVERMRGGNACVRSSVFHPKLVRMRLTAWFSSAKLKQPEGWCAAFEMVFTKI